MIKYIRHGINRLRYHLQNIKTKRSPKWQALEKKMIAEHPFCAACGIRKEEPGSRLQAHHLTPFSSNAFLELVPSNVEIFCMSVDRECHLKIAHGGNFKTHCKNAREYAAITLTNPSRRDEIIALAKKNAIPN